MTHDDAARQHGLEHLRPPKCVVPRPTSLNTLMPAVNPAVTQDKVEARNADYVKIARCLYFGDGGGGADAAGSSQPAAVAAAATAAGLLQHTAPVNGSSATTGSSSAADDEGTTGLRDAEAVIWLGDFNYRVDSPAGFVPDTSDIEHNPVGQQLYMHVHRRVRARVHACVCMCVHVCAHAHAQDDDIVSAAVPA